MEQNHELLAKEVAGLTGTVARVEINQKHAEELNKLRFDALDQSIKNIDGTLERFMGRVNAIIAGEVKLPREAQAEADRADYLRWRERIDTDLDGIHTRNDAIDAIAAARTQDSDVSWRRVSIIAGAIGALGGGLGAILGNLLH